MNKVCKTCNKEFSTYNKVALYCSDKCRLNPKKICRNCNIEFIASSVNQKFCTKECRNKDYNKRAIPCEKCNIKFLPNTPNHKICPRCQNIKCKNCDKEFRYKYNGTKYCADCRIRICEFCGEEYKARKYTQKYCSKECKKKSKIRHCFRCGKIVGHKRKWCSDECRLTKTCAVCNKIFVASWDSTKCCSDECRNKHYRLARGLSEKRRSKKIVIFDRDNYQCIYCGKTSFADNIKLHLDHIIPLVEGGEDIANNLVTACQECNWDKSDYMLKNVESIQNEINNRNKKCDIDSNQIVNIH